MIRPPSLGCQRPPLCDEGVLGIRTQLPLEVSTLGYRDRFTSSRPSCYGHGYDDRDKECLKECPFRQSCYDKCTEDDDDDDQPRRRRLRSSKGKDHRSSSRRDDDLPYPSDDLLDELLYLEDGEPWHHRLGWNALSGGLSAMGGEVQEFFRVFRFQPKARRLPKAPKPLRADEREPGGEDE